MSLAHHERSQGSSAVGTSIGAAPTDKVGAEARLYADDARRQLFEGLHECQALDLATKIRTEANDVEGGTQQFSG